MSTQVTGRQQPARRLHPTVYKAIVALALVLVASIWSFGQSPDTDYLLAVVSMFIGISVALPFIASRVWRHRHPRNENETKPFEEWAEGEFSVWQGKLPARAAAAQVLLPIAAVAFGMTVFAMVVHFSA